MAMTVTKATVRHYSACNFLVVVLICLSVTVRAEKTVQIFIIAGGGNAQGHASIPELHDLCTADDPSQANSTNPYRHLVDSKGMWVTRDDVYVTYEKSRNDGLTHAPLGVKGFGNTPNSFGPDVEFGHVMGDSLKELDNKRDTDNNKIVIVKAAWDKRTLAKDFRPPSAEGLTGFQYLRILSSVKQTISNMGEILGDKSFDRADVEIVGLVWWHGYDDLRKETGDEYEENLQHFLRDIREELELPYLPILIAELGGQGHGDNVTKAELDFRAMQLRITQLPEFNRTTRLLPTAKYHVQDDSPTTDDYTHYYGRAHTMIAIGRAMAVYMIELARIDRDGWNSEEIEAQYEGLENGLGAMVKLFFGLGMAGFVVLVAVMRGKITRESLKKSLRDTMVAVHPESEVEDDNYSLGPSTEMKEGRVEENLVV